MWSKDRCEGKVVLFTIMNTLTFYFSSYVLSSRKLGLFIWCIICWANYLTSFSNNRIYPLAPESWTTRVLVGFCLVQATSRVFSKSFLWVFQTLTLSTRDIPWSFKGNFCAHTITENCLTGRVYFVCGFLPFFFFF